MPRLALTDRFVMHAKAKDAPQVDYFDEGTPGLALRVSEGGTKTWSFIFTSPKDGKRARVKLGTYPAKSLAAARTLAEEARSNVEAQRDPRDVIAAHDTGQVTVAMLCASFLEKHARPNLRTAANLEQRFRKNVIPVIGSIALADLHPRDINRVCDPIVKRGKPTEANRVWENLRGMLRWAVRRGDLDRNPMEAMSKPAAENGARERVLSNSEIAHLWGALPSALAQSKACQRILMLCLFTGQRVGEVAGMRRDELDMQKRLWSLPGSRVKNGTGHTVPIPDSALSIIQDALADVAGSEFVFTSKDRDGKPKPMEAHAVATTLRRAQAGTKKHLAGRFGMAQFTAHDLRRTALTGLAQLGVAPIVIGAVANHLSVTKASVTFAHYVRHDYAAEKRQALDLWAERLQGIISGSAATVSQMRKSATR